MRPLVGERDDVAGVIACAFQDDPPPTWWYPDPHERIAHMLAFWHAIAKAGLAAGDGLISDDGKAVALYIPPGRAVDESATSASGLPDVIAGLGPERASQINTFSAVLDRLHAEAIKEPHWELYCIAVAPSAQGRGLGVALVDEMTQRARRDQVPCFLLTASERNVKFYERRGYRVVERSSVPDSPLQAWAMRLD